MDNDKREGRRGVWGTVKKVHTCALTTTTSNSPRPAEINSANLPHTPSIMPSRLCSAIVDSRFRTTSPFPSAALTPLLLLPLLVCFMSSATMADLSSAVRVGVARRRGSFVSRFNTARREARDFEVLSREESFAAAVYL